MGNKIGVVTVTYNSSEFLGDFIKCCKEQQHQNYRLYCIDNNSGDNTKRILEDIHSSNWINVFNDKNLGVAEGNNQGILKAISDGCDWILLLNNDTKFPKSFFGDLLHACTKSNSAVLVPKIYYDTPKDTIWYAGGGFNKWKGDTGFHTGIGEKDSDKFNVSHKVDYAPTCAMIVNKKIFYEVGLMDQAYFVYFDDTDFCWRLKHNNIKIQYWPEVNLIHKVGGSTGGYSLFTAYITSRNRLFFIKKNNGWILLPFWILIFSAYYITEYLIASWRPSYFSAAMRGSFDFFKMKTNTPVISLDSTNQ
jgi:GT2 family glycosyltransferase